MKLAFLLSLLPLFASSLSYIVELKPHDEDCIQIRPGTNSQRQLDGSYEHLTPGPAELLVLENYDVIMRFQSSRDQFSIPLKPSRRYSVCAQSTQPLADDGRVATPLLLLDPSATQSIAISLQMSKQQQPQQQRLIVDVDTHTLVWNSKSRNVAQGLQSLVQHHQFIKMREADHRNVTEGTFAAILLWTLIEAAMVLTVAVGQVLIFQRYLERKRGGYRSLLSSS